MSAFIHYTDMLHEINTRIYDRQGKKQQFEIKARYTSGARMGQIYRKVCELYESAPAASSKGASASPSERHRRLRASFMLYLLDATSRYTLNIPYWAIIEYNGRRLNHTLLNAQ